MNINCSDAEWDDSQGMIAEGYRDSALWVPRPGVHMVDPQLDHREWAHDRRSILFGNDILIIEE